MSKKCFVVFVVAMMFIFFSIVSEGCGGGSSSSPAPSPEASPETETSPDNPNGVALKDALSKDAEVVVGLYWDDKQYNLKFRNLGNREFEALNLSSDLSFDAQMSYGDSGVSALFTDKEYSDINLLLVVDVSNDTYFEVKSDVLKQLWSHYDGISSFVVNGKEFIEELEWEEEEWPDVERWTLNDLSADKAVLTLEFNFVNHYYHYTWRNLLMNGFKCIDGNKNDLAMYNVNDYGLGYTCFFVDENNGKWLIIAIDPEKSSYSLQTNAEGSSLSNIYVNGEDITKKLTCDASVPKSVIGDSLLKGAWVKVNVICNGVTKELDFINQGNGKFTCLQTSESFNLAVSGSFLIGSVIDGVSWLSFGLDYVGNTYFSVSSNETNRLFSISINGVDVTSQLSEKILE